MTVDEVLELWLLELLWWWQLIGTVVLWNPMQGSLHPKQQGMNLFSIAYSNSQFLFVVHCDSRIVIQLHECNYPVMLRWLRCVLLRKLWWWMRMGTDTNRGVLSFRKEAVFCHSPIVDIIVLFHLQSWQKCHTFPWKWKRLMELWWWTVLTSRC